MHSVPVDAFQAGLLRVRQHNVPNGITDIAQSIGNAEPEAVHWVGINLQKHIAERGCGLQPLVELDAVLHPSVVEALRRLIQDHLKDHFARGDLEKAGAPHLSLPKNPCTICSNSLHVSHPSLSGPFPKG